MGSVAYFCLEYGIEDNLPIYAGGLGILAGDLVLEAGQQGLDFVGLGLFYSHCFTQEKKLDPRAGGFTLEPTTVTVEVADQEVNVRVWSKKYGSAKLFLLDAPEITDFLYGSTPEAMLKQQLVLGVGGLRLLRQLGITPQIYHLNEGHTAMVILELLCEKMADSPGATLSGCLGPACQAVVATKHTIFTGAGLHLTRDQLLSGLKLYLDKYHLNFEELFTLGTHPTHPEIFSTTNFLLKFAHRQSGVSHLHTVMEKTTHPESKLIPITNGVNVSRWQAVNPNADPWSEHQKNKKNLFSSINQLTSFSLDILTVVWARRFTAYKRPELLVSDVNQLRRIANSSEGPVQFILAGQTNPTDITGREMADKISATIKNADLGNKVVFLTDYSLPLAKKLVAGADVWLNTPIPGQEACGTSGMKAALNGGLMLSTNDGWMAEVDWHKLGWILPEENISEALYTAIEREIVPLYYTNQKEWQQRAIRTRSLILDYFNTKRVLADYQQKLYS